MHPPLGDGGLPETFGVSHRIFSMCKVNSELWKATCSEPGLTGSLLPPKKINERPYVQHAACEKFSGLAPFSSILGAFHLIIGGTKVFTAQHPNGLPPNGSPSSSTLTS